MNDTAPQLVSRREAIEHGLSRYYTGRSCTNGHLSERHTLNGTCVECDRNRSRTYRAAKTSNPPQHLADLIAARANLQRSIDALTVARKALDAVLREGQRNAD